MLQILHPAKRKLLSEKLADLANIFGATLVVGQFITLEKLNWTILIWGMVLSIWLYFISVKIHPTPN